MEKPRLLRSALVCILALSLVVFNMAAGEDDDPSLDILCDTGVFFNYADLFSGVLSNGVLFSELCGVSLMPRFIQAYLENHEKSPPAIPFPLSPV